MASLKAIIFDMDGTLADTEEIHRQAFNLAFAEFNFDWQWSADEYRRQLAVSGGKERIRLDLKRRGVAAAGGDDLWKLAERIHRRKSAIYRELLGRGITLRPGIERLIRDAAGRRIAMGIATSSSRSNLETLLRGTLGENAIGLFRAVVTCDIVEDKKPSPAVYQCALAELGLEPRYCVAVEDTRNGNLSARAAGLKTVITTHAYSADNDFSGASLVLDQLGEPGAPFRVLSGDAHGAQYVDVPLLEKLVADRPRRRPRATFTESSALVAK